MLKQSIFITWNPATVAEKREALVTAALKATKGATHSSFGTAVSISQYGDTACHLLFSSKADWEASGIEGIMDELGANPAVGRLESVAFLAERYGITRPELRSGVHRSLLFSIENGTPDQARRCIDDLAAMPLYIPEILNWGMHRTLRVRGAESWSYVWEQEFADESAYAAYLNSDCHCYYVANWWDPEIGNIMSEVARNHASTLSESVMSHYSN